LCECNKQNLKYVGHSVVLYQAAENGARVSATNHFCAAESAQVVVLLILRPRVYLSYSSMVPSHVVTLSLCNGH
jgi:hypothetical protein